MSPMDLCGNLFHQMRTFCEVRKIYIPISYFRDFVVVRCSFHQLNIHKIHFAEKKLNGNIMYSRTVQLTKSISITFNSSRRRFVYLQGLIQGYIWYTVGRCLTCFCRFFVGNCNLDNFRSNLADEKEKRPN